MSPGGTRLPRNSLQDPLGIPRGCLGDPSERCLMGIETVYKLLRYVQRTGRPFSKRSAYSHAKLTFEIRWALLRCVQVSASECVIVKNRTDKNETIRWNYFRHLNHDCKMNRIISMLFVGLCFPTRKIHVKV